MDSYSSKNVNYGLKLNPCVKEAGKSNVKLSIELTVRQYFRKNCMATDGITYNQSSGKLYQNGVPYLNHIFMNEAEAEDYLNHLGLHLHKAGQSNILSSLQTMPQFITGGI